MFSCGIGNKKKPEKKILPWWREYHYHLSDMVAQGNVKQLKKFFDKYEIEDINNIYSVTPYKHRPLLYIAILNRNPEMLKYLLTLDDIDVNIKFTFKDTTPLIVAVRWKMMDMAIILASDPRCDVRAKDVEGYTAIDYAHINGMFKLAAFLVGGTEAAKPQSFLRP